MHSLCDRKLVHSVSSMATTFVSLVKLCIIHCTYYLLVDLQELDDNLAALTRDFEEATSAKLKCQQQAEATANTISLANRCRHIHLHIYTCPHKHI